MRTGKQTTSGCSSNLLSCFWYAKFTCDTTSLFSRSTFAGTFPIGESSVSFLTSCFCPDLPLVPAPPFHTNIPLWPRDHLRSLPSNCPRWGCVDGKRDLESCRSGPPWVCSGPCWVVPEGCLDQRDGWQTHYSKRCPRFTVRVSLRPVFAWLTNELHLGNGCSGIFEKRHTGPFTCTPIPT